MATKSHGLHHGWNLIADKKFKLFSNQNEYVLLDWEGDTVLRISVQDHELAVLGSSWDLNFKINLAFKTIKIINEPSDEE
jgi:hypothetical protein